MEKYNVHISEAGIWILKPNRPVSYTHLAEMQLARSNDDPGAGDMVNRCIMEIYHLKGDAYEKYGEREVVALNEKAATFNVRLVAGQTYNCLLYTSRCFARRYGYSRETGDR